MRSNWGMRGRIPGACAVLAAIVALAGCGTSEDEPRAGTPGAGPSLAALPADAGHVHGIVPGPRPGQYLIGTHAGLYRVTAGSAERVGDQADYMGLAREGTALLSSGHPDPTSGEPNPLGLRRSTDGGRTWARITAVPRDDFHIVRAGGGAVYALGMPGSALYRGAGSEALKAGPVPTMAPFDLAVNPVDGSTIIAATEAGQSISRNGGTSWRPVSSMVGLLAWPAAAALYMVDAGGRVSVSADEGVSWSSRGQIGDSPAAFAATSATDLVAARHDGGLVRSSDGGRTWN